MNIPPENIYTNLYNLFVLYCSYCNTSISVIKMIAYSEFIIIPIQDKKINVIVCSLEDHRNTMSQRNEGIPMQILANDVMFCGLYEIRISAGS